MNPLIKKIAEECMMQYVHETNLTRFSELLLKEFCIHLDETNVSPDIGLYITQFLEKDKNNGRRRKN